MKVSGTNPFSLCTRAIDTLSPPHLSLYVAPPSLHCYPLRAPTTALNLSIVLSPTPKPNNIPVTQNSLRHGHLAITSPLPSPPSKPRICYGLPLQLLHRHNQRHKCHPHHRRSCQFLHPSHDQWLQPILLWQSLPPEKDYHEETLFLLLKLLEHLFLLNNLSLHLAVDPDEPCQHRAREAGVEWAGKGGRGCALGVGSF